MFTERIKELGLTIPTVPTPLAAYIPGTIVGNLAMTSGQLPMVSGVLEHKGKLGENISVEIGQKEAQKAVMNCLGVIDSIVEGGLDNIEKIVKLTVFVSCNATFTEHPKVANGASDLLLSIFGEKGKHARAAVGVASLPLDAPVEIELIAQIK